MLITMVLKLNMIPTKKEQQLLLMDFHVPGSVHNNDLHNQLRKTIVPALEIKKNPKVQKSYLTNYIILLQILT